MFLVLECERISCFSFLFQISDRIVAKLMAGQELAEVMEEIMGHDVRSGPGMMGVVTSMLLLF